MTNDKIKEILIAYMQCKIEDQDWHAVSDVANDLRELELLIKHDIDAHENTLITQALEKGSK